MTVRTTAIRVLAATGAAALAALVPAGAAVAKAPTPVPSASGQAVADVAGTSFLTASAVRPGQPVRVDASVGDYLYWSFPAVAGHTYEVALTVTLPPAQNRHGASAWTVEVFDGLRRRQACTSGAQSPSAAQTDASLTLGCTLREIRSWAEPWSGDPLPGTYYVRLSVADLPEQDLGLPCAVEMTVTGSGDGDGKPADAKLSTPLSPNLDPGATLAPGASASPAPDGSDGALRWLPSLSTRWVWSAIGGVLAAVAGVVGFALTRPRRRAGTG